VYRHPHDPAGQHAHTGDPGDVPEAGDHTNEGEILRRQERLHQVLGRVSDVAEDE